MAAAGPHAGTVSRSTEAASRTVKTVSSAPAIIDKIPATIDKIPGAVATKPRTASGLQQAVTDMSGHIIPHTETKHDR